MDQKALTTALRIKSKDYTSVYFFLLLELPFQFPRAPGTYDIFVCINEQKRENSRMHRLRSATDANKIEEFHFDLSVVGPVKIGEQVVRKYQL